MSESFVIREHKFEGQHLREYPRALALSQEDTIWLHAKSYTPQEVANGSVMGDLTIIAWHANSVPKEVYEPFFEALYRYLRDKQNLTVGSIWIADQASQNTSALLNDEKLGNDPSWFDHSRDVLAMTNTFRKYMIRPICAVGHSMGATQAVALAHFHPRMFETIVMIDPSISPGYVKSMKAMLKYALRKPETYKSREQVEKQVRSTPFFKAWESKPLERYIDTAFHSFPTVAYPDNSVKPTTSKYAEAATLIRPNTQHVKASGSISGIQRALHPNLDDSAPLTGPAYNPHTRITWFLLPSLRPSALYLLGEGSHILSVNDADERTKMTGTGIGGSGGVAAGNVKSVTIPGGHFLPMTNVQGTAKATAEWLGSEIRNYRKREEAIAADWGERKVAEKQKLEPTVVKTLSDWDGKPWAKDTVLSEKSRL